MSNSKDISLERGSGLLNRRARAHLTHEKPSKLASEIISRNEKGKLRVFVAGGSRAGNDEVYCDQAFQLGEAIGILNYRLDFGLSSKGIMGAVARGLIQAWSNMGKKGKSPIFGITTKEYLALYQSDEVLDEVSQIVVADTLEERKQQLLAADLVIFAPGGVGTLDELVYDCVAMQDGFLDFKPFILFNVKGFFHHILEFLKEINLKGFSEAMPFVVVDNAEEASLAFKTLEYLYCGKATKENARELLEDIIYKLPYIFQEHRNHPHRKVKAILENMEKILNGKNQMEHVRLASEIDQAYLSKEIERMYERLAKAGHDTATVSDKLHALKERHLKR